MGAAGRKPVVIGIGDFVNRSKRVEDAIEPMQLMLNAIDEAFRDIGVSPEATSTLRTSIDSLDIVRTWTWPYPDLPSLISRRLGIDPIHKHYSEHGGNQPGYLFDEAARRISKGESKVAVVVGGEALSSLSACAAAKQMPPPGWTPLEEEVTTVFSPTTHELKPDLGALHGIGNPIQVYPLYENGFRAHKRQSVADNHVESAKMYAEFAKVAESNQYAWSYGSPAETERTIATVSKKNRMICFPYTLLMNAFNNINLAGACILTSTAFARELGVPEDRWIYALGGAGTRDSNDFWERPSFHTSPAISRSLDACLQVSGLSKDEIDLFDFYSCFPIVPKLACDHLGLSTVEPPKPVTLLGGLTSFGGAGNNYSMHAITEMVRQLRSGKGKTGLILANGGVVTYQHALCFSSTPRTSDVVYPQNKPLPKVITDVPVPQVEAKAQGEAVIETYTVEFGRDGKPHRAYVVGRLVANEHRFIANHGDERTLHALCSPTEEQIGKKGQASVASDGRNVFIFGESAKL